MWGGEEEWSGVEEAGEVDTGGGQRRVRAHPHRHCRLGVGSAMQGRSRFRTFYSPSKSDTQMKPFFFLFASIRDFDPPAAKV